MYGNTQENKRLLPVKVNKLFGHNAKSQCCYYVYNRLMYEGNGKLLHYIFR